MSYASMLSWFVICSIGFARSPFAAATAARSSTNPIGISHTTLSHRFAPTRTRGAIPYAAGNEPAHVVGSIVSSPFVSRVRGSCAGGVSRPSLTENLERTDFESWSRGPMMHTRSHARQLSCQCPLHDARMYVLAARGFRFGGGFGRVAPV